MFLHHLTLCAPLFLLVFIGWAFIKTGFFKPELPSVLGSFTFRLLMPALLFKLMSHLSEMPPVDWRVLIVFFGSCIIIYACGRVVAKKCFGLGPTGQTVIGMAGIFGNNVQLGVPIVQVSLGDAAMPTISILIIFNVLLLWTLAIASVEFGKAEGPMNWGKIGRSMLKVFKNPVVLGIITGCAWGLTGLELPFFVAKTVDYIAASTTPMCLIVVGMGLAKHSFRQSLSKGTVITFFKIALQPALVWVLARLVGLGPVETHAVVLMAALPVAINVYLMATEFQSEEGAASNGIFVSTLLSSLGVPLVLTLLGVVPNL